jgi:hypothetical protein
MATITTPAADASKTVAVHGFCDDRFRRVHDVLAANLTTGLDIGASAAVFLDGERRIAYWGGAGGSILVNDFAARMTVSFVMNRHLEHGGIDQRGIGIVCAAYDSLADGQ